MSLDALRWEDGKRLHNFAWGMLIRAGALRLLPGQLSPCEYNGWVL